MTNMADLTNKLGDIWRYGAWHPAQSHLLWLRIEISATNAAKGGSTRGSRALLSRAAERSAFVHLRIGEVNERRCADGVSFESCEAGTNGSIDLRVL